MPPQSPRWSLVHAAQNGAVVGPITLLLNLHFQGNLTATPVFNLVLMLVGGAAGGAVLFVAIALFVRFLSRRAG